MKEEEEEEQIEDSSEVTQ